MDIKKLSKQIHATNVKKGFWAKKNQGEKLFLIISELSELIEADRKSRVALINEFECALERQKKFTYSKKHKQSIKIDFFEKYIKDSVGDELADAFIRLCDYCIGFNLKINEKAIKEKAEELTISCDELGNLGDALLNVSGLIYLLRINENEGYHIPDIFAHFIYFANKLKVPLEKHVKYKMWYNSTRPKMHNKKY